MDPVKYIFEKPALTGRIAWWQVLLSDFDIVYVTQKVIKGSAWQISWLNNPSMTISLCIQNSLMRTS